MHFEVLIEDQSGKNMLDIVFPKIINEHDTYKIHPYKGIGHVPKGLNPKSDPKKRILLSRLPIILAGYGRAFAKYPEGFCAVVIVVCDLDSKNLGSFVSELKKINDACVPAPETRFCIAVEEGEAWLLGDVAAIKKAYPSANDSVLSGYSNDSICGTWETLAEAIYKGGVKALTRKGPMEVGRVKSEWANLICPHMDADKNSSPSFQFFRNTIARILS